MPQEPQAPFISSTEAAKRFNLTNDHIGLLCRKQKVQGTLLGRLWYVSEPSLAAYIQKNAEVQATRRKALSQQLRTMRVVGLLALSLFVYSGGEAKAQVPAGPQLHVEQIIPEPVAPEPTLIEKSVVQIKNSFTSIPPIKPIAAAALAPQVPEVRTGQSFAAAVVDGAQGVGETLGAIKIPNIFAKHERAHTVHIVHAKEVFYGQDGQPALIAAVAGADSGDSLATLIAINQRLTEANKIMFGIYADSLAWLARAAVFDAEQVAYVADKTFGEFGRQFTHDVYVFGDAQTNFYIQSAAALAVAYNIIADISDAAPTLTASISVASIEL